MPDGHALQRPSCMQLCLQHSADNMMQPLLMGTIDAYGTLGLLPVICAELNKQVVGVLPQHWCAELSTSACACPAQGVVKAALVRAREGYAGKARLLGEEALALQEGLDAARHTAAERADENAAAAQQVPGLVPWAGMWLPVVACWSFRIVAIVGAVLWQPI